MISEVVELNLFLNLLTVLQALRLLRTLVQLLDRKFNWGKNLRWNIMLTCRFTSLHCHKRSITFELLFLITQILLRLTIFDEFEMLISITFLLIVLLIFQLLQVLLGQFEIFGWLLPTLTFSREGELGERWNSLLRSRYRDIASILNLTDVILDFVLERVHVVWNRANR